MSSTKLRVAVALALALLVAVGGGIFFVAFEKVERTVREKPSGEAARNPFLALERLANRAGYDVVTYRELNLPDESRMIFLTDPSTRPAPDQVEDWTHWVQTRGGHLIMSVPDMERGENQAPLLAGLGFKKDAAGQKWPDSVATHTYIFDTDIFDSDKDASDIPEAEALGGWSAADADWQALTPKGQVVAASRPAGDGRITLVAHSHYFRSFEIGNGEAAGAIIDIFALKVPSSTLKELSPVPTLSIVLFGKRQSWMAYVLGHTWPYFVCLLIMLGFAIQRGRRRFGPMLADPAPQRRSRLEHIGAMGRFFWQQNAPGHLVVATQKALMRALEQRNPELRSARGARRWEIVAQMLDIDPASARKLFRTPIDERHAERFSARIRALETYRRQL